jgi:Ca2+-binding EF-hand superfamily protein
LTFEPKASIITVEVPMNVFEKQMMVRQAQSWAMRVRIEKGEVSFPNVIDVLQDNNIRPKDLTQERFAAMIVQVANGNDGFIHFED